MKPTLTKTGKKAFLAPFRWIIVAGLVFFLASGDINNPCVWIYCGTYAIGGLISSFVLYKKKPRLLNDRGKMQKGTKQFDKHLLLTYFLFALVITPLAAGIDNRLDLTEALPFIYYYVGISLYLISALLSTWPMLHNPFFEGTVRIQTNKNHTVISS